MTRNARAVEDTARVRGETPHQVLDRNLNELLQELRVVLTGVQILFAFLLALAFTARIPEMGTFPVAVYALTLLSTACAAVLLIAPVSYHRTLFRLQRKEQLVAFTDRALQLGLALLLIAITSALLLVLDVVLGRSAAVVGCSAVVVLGLVSWYALPLAQRRRE
jgi:Family of unknown function (DUF6328)